MSNIGIKISQPGFDVKTAADNELVIKSSYPALKIHSVGSGTESITYADGGEYITLATHNLGYRPFFAVWADRGDGYQLCTFSGASGDYTIMYMGTSTTTTLLFGAKATYTGGFFGDPTTPDDESIDYAWVIFYDPIEA